MIAVLSDYYCRSLQLTGESLPVRKIAAVGNVEMARPGGDELPVVYSGTLVVQGKGIVKVRSIGTQTEMGKIGNALQKVQPEVTPLHWHHQCPAWSHAVLAGQLLSSNRHRRSGDRRKCDGARN